MGELLTSDEAARLLGKAHRTVRGYITRGQLPIARRVNARFHLVSRAEVARWPRPPPPRRRQHPPVDAQP